MMINKDIPKKIMLSDLYRKRVALVNSVLDLFVYERTMSADLRLVFKRQAALLADDASFLGHCVARFGDFDIGAADFIALKSDVYGMVWDANVNPWMRGIALIEDEVGMPGGLRYFLLSEVKLVMDSKRFMVNQPSCWDDLVAVYSYMVGRGGIVQAQRMLGELFSGGLPVTNLKKAVAGNLVA